ncbi:MAG: TonB-dependent receptor [Terriglobales bacterium]
MRFGRFAFLIFLSLASLSAAADELKIRVVDPDQLAVAGARVAVYRAESSIAVAVQTTTAAGGADFTAIADGAYHVEVLAPGFAAHWARVEVPQSSAHTVKLEPAPRAETVVVTAAGTPLPVEEGGAPVALLDGAEIETMRPLAISEALRFLPGAVINAAGRRGGLASLFVRGGNSSYNKVIVDGVPLNDPGGIFDFGVVPLQEAARLEFVRGAESTLYGSDAMTSVVQVWTGAGRTRVPELRFGADGGRFGTANGYAALSGARGRADFNLFADHIHSDGQGVNDEYSNSSQGANFGVSISPRAAFRLRVRHSNSRTGVPNAWKFNGDALLAPDLDQFARQNNFLASAEITLAAPVRWLHRLTGFEYNHKRSNEDNADDRGCDPAIFNFLDCFFAATTKINRAGLNYQGEYSPRAWARTAFGYEFEVENGRLGSEFLSFDFLNNTTFIGESRTRGLRRNHGLFAQQVFTRGRFAIVGGLRFVHNESFGNQVVPRISVSFLARRGGDGLSGTRLRFAYGEGIKAPTFEESFGFTGTFPADPNPDLKPEQSRSLEAGFQQEFGGGRFALAGTYFHNLFRNQIAFSFNPTTFTNIFINVNESFAHGAEVEFHGRLRSNLTLEAAYLYTSTQILEAPLAFDPLFSAGAPLLRRPRHAGSVRLGYLYSKWGGHVGGSFVGRRPDSDFFTASMPFNHAEGYARVDVGGWYALHPRVTAYANVENLFDRDYNEVVGYPGLGASFRAGLRFRVGGE